MVGGVVGSAIKLTLVVLGYRKDLFCYEKYNYILKNKILNQIKLFIQNKIQVIVIVIN